MEFQIKGKYPGQPTEVIDTAKTQSEANYLLQEYRMAFDCNWTLWIKSTKPNQRREESL